MNRIIDILKTIITRGLESFGGVYYSQYRGIVTRNNDPVGHHRIKVQIPEITGPNEHPAWVIPMGLLANKKEGMQFLPLVGEVVWISFEYGNPRKPVYRLGYRAAGDFVNIDRRSPDWIWIQTKSGTSIAVNRETGEISLSHFSGKILRVTNKIELGSSINQQPAVLSNPLESIITNLITTLQQATVTAQPLDPVTLAKLEALKASVQSIKSTSIFIDP